LNLYFVLIATFALVKLNVTGCNLCSFVCMDEIKVIIKKLKNNKACGTDNVINEFLKNCPEMMISLIVHLFNLMLETGLVPEDWCTGIVKPIYKNNYRGITLLIKVMKVISNQRGAFSASLH
uniref:Reverse transcriptase domain-containing protein n=1 Tax=Amphilophus citrinellus TaxID=61819 RepID=A0A3Q0SFA9_AMPCI